MDLIDRLVRDFGVDESEIDRAERFQSKYGGRLEHILVNLGIANSESVASALADSIGVKFVEPTSIASVVALALADLSEQNDFLFERSWFKLPSNGDKWLFLTHNPVNFEAINYLEYLNREYDIWVCSESSWREIVGAVQVSDSFDLQIENFSDLEVEKLKELASEAPVVNLVNSLISKSIGVGSSDLHIEPSGKVFKARVRVDGVLRDLDYIPSAMSLAVISRIKILAGMDIAEKRRPQDGKIATKIAGQEIDIRVSALPLSTGESIVMRFLLKESIQFDMGVLGISDDIRLKLTEDLTKTSGVILLTGPTGSGKTTSLYSFLNRLNNDKVKIITLEDPVEYQLEGVNQIQVRPDLGFDFAGGLRSILRQDPDILMVGEIRDGETAKIAMQSALTGHLVFSTLHTNDSASAYTRLIDLGVEEFLLNAALVSIVAQRLARKLCTECSVPAPAEYIKELLELYPSLAAYSDGLAIKEKRGCDACAHTGYSGRVAIVEYLRIDDSIRSFPKGANFIHEVHQYMKTTGSRGLFDDGLFKVASGMTTIDEVVRVAG